MKINIILNKLLKNKLHRHRWLNFSSTRTSSSLAALPEQTTRLTKYLAIKVLRSMEGIRAQRQPTPTRSTHTSQAPEGMAGNRSTTVKLRLLTKRRCTRGPPLPSREIPR